MAFRYRLDRAAAAVALLLGLGQTGRAQDRPVQRIATIVSVAVEEYGKGVDSKGRLISDDEYQEAKGFLDDARGVAARLPGNAAAPRALLDSIGAAMTAKRPSSELVELNQRFAASLGSEAKLELPRTALSLADGEQAYNTTCAPCLGVSGRGDGPSAATLIPMPPAVGDAATMHDVTPAMMFRKVSIGVSGTAMPAFSTLTAEQRWNVVMYLTSLRHGAAKAAEGEGLYVQGCASCHGLAGFGDGAAARSLSKLPPELGAFPWQVERTDDQIAQAI